MNYLAKDKKTNEYFRIFGCSSREEALRFIDPELQELVVLSDDEVGEQGIEIIEG